MPLRVHPDVVAQRLGEETVLVHLQSNEIYRLNPTGVKIWEQLRAGRRRDQIVSELLEEYDIDEAELTEEIDGLISRLSEEGLVQSHDGD